MALSKFKESTLKEVDDTKLLSENEDYFDIVEAVSNLAAEYRTFGIGLGILASRLDEIKRQREAATTVKDKFTEVVRLRLSRPPPPTWKTFIDAAKSINRALAQNLEQIIPTQMAQTLTQPLEEKDLGVVTDKFNNISARYKQFGAALKISPGKLEEIGNEISVRDLLQDVVLEFLRSPRPDYKQTWRTIVSAAFDINPALAKEIAKEHPVKISKSSKPDKQTPSSTSPLAVSSSPIVESPNVPSTSESAHISTTSATGRVATDLGNINDSDTDSDDPLPPVSKNRKVSDPVQGKCIDTDVVSFPSGVVFQLCGIDELKDEPLQQISESGKKFLPRALLQLDSIPPPKQGTPLNGKGVEIAVLDSGIYLHHEVFQSKGENQIGGCNFVIGDPPHSWYDKPELHGTAVAAIAAGNMYSSPSGQCTGGIAPSAKLYICRVYSHNETKWEWIISALDHLIDLKQKSKDRIDVIVMSFGCQPKVAQVEDRLKKLADLGVVLVAAGGNSGPRPDDTDFPASDIHVISVGALDKKVGSKTRFSSAHCHVYAPGESVCVPSVINQSTTDVCYVDGTSFAAPILGGFLALLLESANNNVSNSTFVIEKCHDINFLNTLLKDHKLVRDYKLWYAHEVVENLQDDPGYIEKLVERKYGRRQ